MTVDVQGGAWPGVTQGRVHCLLGRLQTVSLFPCFLFFRYDVTSQLRRKFTQEQAVLLISLMHNKNPTSGVNTANAGSGLIAQSAAALCAVSSYLYM